MRKALTSILPMLLMLCVAGCAEAGTKGTGTSMSVGTTPSAMTSIPDSDGVLRIAPNRPLVSHVFTADPSAHVFDGRIYLYPSHDQDTVFPSDNNGSQYQMTDYHVFSMGTEDTAVTDHGVVLALEDIPWADRQLWAPDAAYKDGVYHLFFPAKDPDGIFRIGVATGTSPAGPFTAESRPIEGSFSIDPAAFTDEDGRTYLFFGGIWGGQLQCWANGRYEENAKIPSGSAPALGPVAAELSDDLRSFKTAPVEVRILDEQGSPLKASDEDRRFFEGSWVHKYNGLYYLSYSTGTTHYIVYATSEHPLGPYTYRGRILEPVSGWTTQHSIVEYLGKWYLFYHDCELSGGVDSQRNVKYTELFHNVDGTIRPVVR